MGRATVFVVDDDIAVRDSLSLLIGSMGLKVETFACADDFLTAYEPGAAGCLLLDIRMPGMSGTELHEELNRRGYHVPVIFITGHGDISMAVRAMQHGAVDFIEKPFNDQQLLDRINQALVQDKQARIDNAEMSAIGERLKALTPRETEVMRRVVAGEANKRIALDLGLSERTIEIHRAKVMAKTGAATLAELVKMVARYDAAQQ